MEELIKLINFIQMEYKLLNNKWQKSEDFTRINLHNKQVCDVIQDELILNSIFKYREFINKNNIQLIMDFKQFNTNTSKVNIRTKNKNSIEYKIRKYTEKKEKGKIPIDKCLNDLFGIRIICKEKLSYDEIKTAIESKYNNLKCIDSSKQEYKATHIYFKIDNYQFQWELQVWNSDDEKNNIYSHEKYKQDYIKWEKEMKRGEG